MTRILSIPFLCALTAGCHLNPNWPERSALPLTTQVAPSGEMPSNFVRLPAMERARFYVLDLSTK